MKEVFKPIKGYENYEISNFGRVRNIKTERIMKQTKTNKGYLIVGLRKHNIQKKFLIHQLVAQTFILNPDKHSIINHKDEDKTNNRVDNLEWCTVKYNNNYGTRNERMAKTMIRGRNCQPIDQFDLNGNFIKTWFSGAEIKRQLDYDTSAIYGCCHGKFTHRYNYIWKYHYE